MSRSVPEWIGATPDAMPPPRVRLRIWDRAQGRCGCCGRKIMAGEAWQADHIVAIINGGENRESNMQPILVAHHKQKTRSDVAQKSKSYRVRAKSAGIRLRNRPSFATNRDGLWKKRMDGSVVRR